MLVLSAGCNAFHVQQFPTCQSDEIMSSADGIDDITVARLAFLRANL